MRRHLRLMVLVGATACAAPPAPPPTVARPVEPPPPAAPMPEQLPSYDAIRSAVECLADGLEERERRRAWLRHPRRIDWTLDGALDETPVAVADGDELRRPPGEVVVLERHASHLRILWNAPGLRTAFYASMNDFAELVAERTTLMATSGEPHPHGVGVTVPGGTELALGPTRDGVRMASFLRDWIEARGAVVDEAIDRVYERRGAVDLDIDTIVTGPVTVRAAPGGAVVAELRDGAFGARRHDRPSQGAQRVTLARDGVTVGGVVPTESVRDLHEGEGLGSLTGFGLGTGFGMSHATFLYLWPGDLLYASGVSEPVAVVTRRRLRVVDRGAMKDGHALDVHMPPWDFVSLRLDGATHERAVRREQARLDRVGFSSVSATPTSARDDVVATLDWLRGHVADCYEAFLAEHPSQAVRYRVTLDIQAAQTTVTAEPEGPDPALDGCVERALRSRRRDLYGTRARFEVTLDPTAIPGIRPGGASSPPAGGSGGAP